jgi:hypothetical protein
MPHLPLVLYVLYVLYVDVRPGLERANMPLVPLVVVVSDFEGRGAHSWIENKAQYAVCGTSICRQQVSVSVSVSVAVCLCGGGVLLRRLFSCHCNKKMTKTI